MYFLSCIRLTSSYARSLDGCESGSASANSGRRARGSGNTGWWRSWSCGYGSRAWGSDGEELEVFCLIVGVKRCSNSLQQLGRGQLEPGRSVAAQLRTRCGQRTRFLLGQVLAGTRTLRESRPILRCIQLRARMGLQEGPKFLE